MTPPVAVNGALLSNLSISLPASDHDFHCAEYLGKEKKRMKNSKCYGEEYTLRKNVSMEMRMKQNEELKGKIGYID